MLFENKLRLAHRFSYVNKNAILNSKVCGCFYCVEIVGVKEIVEWVDGDKTALCPLCGIDAIIGDASGYDISENFLNEMNKMWFGENNGK